MKVILIQIKASQLIFNNSIKITNYLFHFVFLKISVFDNKIINILNKYHDCRQKITERGSIHVEDGISSG